MRISKAWQMVAIAFTTQNCALTMGTVAYGAALATVQEDFGIERGVASMGSAVMLLALGLLSPIIGNLLQRIPLRTAMTTGAILSALGYTVLATAQDFTYVLVAFAVLIGPGACMLGPVSVTTLVSRWFDKDRGKALGIANMPLFMLFVPPMAALLILEGGRQMLFLTLAAIFALLVPVLRAVKERPDEAPPAAPNADGSAPPQTGQVLTNTQLLTDGRFWALNLAIGIVSASGSAFVTHAVPLATSKGIDFAVASSVLSVFGVGTLVGSIVFGWLIDRIGALPSLVTGATILVCVWLGLWVFDALPALLLVAGVMGATMGSTNAMHGATVAYLFGAPSVSRAMGLAYFIKVPFLFAWTPLLGYLFDLYGDYHVALLVSAGATGCSAVTFLFLALFVRRKRRAANMELDQARGASLR